MSLSAEEIHVIVDAVAQWRMQEVRVLPFLAK